MKDKILLDIYNNNKEKIQQIESIILEAINIDANDINFYRRKAKAYFEQSELFKEKRIQLQKENDITWLSVYEWECELYHYYQFASVYSDALTSNDPNLYTVNNGELVPYAPLPNFLIFSSRFSTIIKKEEASEKSNRLRALLNIQPAKSEEIHVDVPLEGTRLDTNISEQQEKELDLGSQGLKGRVEKDNKKTQKKISQAIIAAQRKIANFEEKVIKKSQELKISLIDPAAKFYVTAQTLEDEFAHPSVKVSEKKNLVEKILFNYHAAITFNHNYYAAYYARGLFSIKNKDFSKKDAKSDFEKSLESKVHENDSHFYLGEIARNHEEFYEAFTHYKKACEFYGENIKNTNEFSANAKRSLKELEEQCVEIVYTTKNYFSKEKLRKSIKAGLVLLEMRIDTSEVNAILGMCYMRLGDKKSACDYYFQAFEGKLKKYDVVVREVLSLLFDLDENRENKFLLAEKIITNPGFDSLGLDLKEKLFKCYDELDEKKCFYEGATGITILVKAWSGKSYSYLDSRVRDKFLDYILPINLKFYQKNWDECNLFYKTIEHDSRLSESEKNIFNFSLSNYNSLFDVVKHKNPLEKIIIFLNPLIRIFYILAEFCLVIERPDQAFKWYEKIIEISDFQSIEFGYKYFSWIKNYISSLKKCIDLEGVAGEEKCKIEKYKDRKDFLERLVNIHFGPEAQEVLSPLETDAKEISTVNGNILHSSVPKKITDLVGREIIKRPLMDVLEDGNMQELDAALHSMLKNRGQVISARDNKSVAIGSNPSALYSRSLQNFEQSSPKHEVVAPPK